MKSSKEHGVRGGGVSEAGGLHNVSLYSYPPVERSISRFSAGPRERSGAMRGTLAKISRLNVFGFPPYRLMQGNEKIYR